MQGPKSDKTRESNGADALVRKYDRQGPRYTSYPTVPAWHKGFRAGQWQEALRAANTRAEDPLALYVHIPFCQHRCLFCACNVVITQREDVASDYLNRLNREIDLVTSLLPARRSVRGVHWGGGTPTHLSVAQIRALWQKLQSSFSIDMESEISIEIHPAVTTVQQLDCLRELGFNRLSLGVQDFDWNVQQIIERWQSLEVTENLLNHARHIGIGSINFDLIYGLPGQTSETWNYTLEQTQRLRPDRLAIYSYARVPWIHPHQKRMPDELLPPAQEKMKLFATAKEFLLKAGYCEIGFDHFALPNDEIVRAYQEHRLYRNFMGYTVKPAPESIGFGVSAISELNECFSQNSAKLNRWNQAMDARRPATERGIELSDHDRRRKWVIEQLMCNFFVDFRAFESFARLTFLEEYQSEWEALQEFEDDGLVLRHQDGLEVTSLGRSFVRNIAMVFDDYLPEQEMKNQFSKTV